MTAWSGRTAQFQLKPDFFHFCDKDEPREEKLCFTFYIQLLGDRQSVLHMTHRKIDFLRLKPDVYNACKHLFKLRLEKIKFLKVRLTHLHVYMQE